MKLDSEFSIKERISMTFVDERYDRDRDKK